MIIYLVHIIFTANQVNKTLVQWTKLCTKLWNLVQNLVQELNPEHCRIKRGNSCLEGNPENISKLGNYMCCSGQLFLCFVSKISSTSSIWRMRSRPFTGFKARLPYSRNGADCIFPPDSWCSVTAYIFTWRARQTTTPRKWPRRHAKPISTALVNV